MKKRNVTPENIDKYLVAMAFNASRQLFFLSRGQIDFDDLKQEAQVMKLHAIAKYNPNVKGVIPLEAWIVFCVKRHFVQLARHYDVIERHKEKEASPESFLPVCDPEEKEYCEHLLSMVKIDTDREVLKAYAEENNDRVVAENLGVSKQMVNVRRHRAIANIMEKTNV